MPSQRISTKHNKWLAFGQHSEINPPALCQKSSCVLLSMCLHFTFLKVFCCLHRNGTCIKTNKTELKSHFNLKETTTLETNLRLLHSPLTLKVVDSKLTTLFYCPNIARLRTTSYLKQARHFPQMQARFVIFTLPNFITSDISSMQRSQGTKQWDLSGDPQKRANAIQQTSSQILRRLGSFAHVHRYTQSSDIVILQAWAG